MTPTEDAEPTTPDGDIPPTYVPHPFRRRADPGAEDPLEDPPLRGVNAARYSRQSLIKQIEQITATTLICYVSPNSEIHRDDVIGMVDLLHNVMPGTPIDLLLHSPGGNIDAAEESSSP